MVRCLEAKRLLAISDVIVRKEQSENIKKLMVRCLQKGCGKEDDGVMSMRQCQCERRMAR